VPEILFEYTDTGTVFCLLTGLVYLVYFKRLSQIERPIVLVIWLNIACDLFGYFFGTSTGISGAVYNVLLPIERILSLYIYGRATRLSDYPSIYNYGIGLVLLIRSISIIYLPDFKELDLIANSAEGLTVAILSYAFVRSIVKRGKIKSPILLGFGIANFAYLMIMASAMSAYRLAYQESESLGTALYYINIIGYSFWSFILITAILWKSRT
jgi:hypothetical protein